MEGVKMIYDALDNLSKPVENDWTEKIERLERKVDGFIAKIKLYEEALEVACDEVEKILDGADYSCSLCFIDEDSMPIGDCDNDCGVCLKTYFLKRGQANIDMQSKKKVGQF